MKKIVLTVAALAVVTGPASSMAAGDNFYLKGNVGVGMPMDTDITNLPENAGTATMTFDSGFSGTLAGGYNFALPFRVEAEYLWQKNDLNQLSYNNRFGNFTEGDLKTQAFMANGFYDVDTGSPWSPYVGAGLGWAKLDLSTPALPFNGNDNVFAYQLMAGVAYAINDQWSVDGQYRFFGTADATINGADFNSHSNNLFVGVRYNF